VRIYDVRPGDVIAYTGMLGAKNAVEVDPDVRLALRYNGDRKTPRVELLDNELLKGCLTR